MVFHHPLSYLIGSTFIENFARNRAKESQSNVQFHDRMSGPTCVRQNSMREKETSLFWIVKMSAARFFVKPSNYERLAVDSDSSSDATEEPSGMYYLLSHNSKCFAYFHKRLPRICFERNLSVIMFLFIYFTDDSMPMPSMVDTGLGVVSYEAAEPAVRAVTLPIRSTYRKYSPRDCYIIGKYTNETGSTAAVRKFRSKFPNLKVPFENSGRNTSIS